MLSDRSESSLARNNRRFARRAAVALAAAAVGSATPCAAQSGTTPQPSPGAAARARRDSVARLTPDQIAATAKLTIAVGMLRDTTQKYLAMSRNKTVEAQGRLRDDLVTQVKKLVTDAGMTDAEYRRRMFLVSTDSSMRVAYETAVTKLTGVVPAGPAAAGATNASAGVAAAAAPTAGGAAAEPATAKGADPAQMLAVPPGPAGVHVGHVANAFGDTPGGRGLLPTAMAEARTAAQHAALAMRTPDNLASIQTHARHVLHAVDPTADMKGPGLGYGVKRAATGVAAHAELAAKAQGAPESVVMHAAHVATAARNSAKRADDMAVLVRKIEASTTAADAAALASQLQALANELVGGKDANTNGRVEIAEGGLAMCEEHVKLMVGAPPGGR